MAQRAPDHALRRALAQLADLPPADAEAVLAELDPMQRRRTQALLQEAQGRPLLAEDGRWRQAGISPWLLERITAPGSGVTPAVQAALREAASAVAEASVPAVIGSSSLLGRVWRSFGARR